MKRLSLFLAVACIGLLLVERTFGEIKRIDGRKCNRTATIAQGQKTSFTIHGPWVDWASDNSSVSGNGVTLRVVERRKGFAKRDPMVRIECTARNNATTGNRTVTLRYPSGQDRFTLRVVRRARITSVDVPTFSGPFQNNIDIRLQGSGLRNAGVRANILVNSFTPLLDAGGQPTGARVVSAEVNRSTSNDQRVNVRLNLSKRLTMATVQLVLTSRDGCSGLEQTGLGLGRKVALQAPVAGANYVKQIRFPQGSTFQVGSLASIDIVMDRASPAAPSRRGRRAITVSRKLPAGEIVYWKLIPADAFTAVAGGTPYKPNALNKLVIPPGQQSQQITLQVSRCPGPVSGRNRLSQVKIQTWRLNTNANQAPEFREATFRVSCPR